MTDNVTPEAGQKWVRLHMSYEILEVEDKTVRMKDHYNNTVEETLDRFQEEVEAGRAVHHPPCENCQLPVDPETGRSGPLHYGCWFERASVRERCESEVNHSGGSVMAAEALRSDNAKEHLLSVVGDPARTLHDRIDAENLLSGAVPTSELLDATVRCPNCLEGEVFNMDPHTGAVRCHCGVLLKPAD